MSDGPVLEFVADEDVNVQVVEMVDVIARHAIVAALHRYPIAHDRSRYTNVSDGDWQQVVRRLEGILAELNPDECLFKQAYGFLHGRQLRGEA